MKKIMLVDDEILTRESIRNSVDWLSHGYIYCGDASDGEMALPLIEEWQPEILITDIRMPFMDGIELATIVRQNYPHIKIIILSGHDEFHFAQKVIRIGVQDYCLKPVGAQDLLALLDKVSKQIDQEQQKREVSSYNAEKLLSDICGGLISTSKALEIAKLFNMSLLARHYAVFIVEFINEQQDEQQDDQLYKVTEEKIISYFDNSIEWHSYRANRKELVYILQGQEHTQMQYAIQYIVSNIDFYLSHYVVVGVGYIKTRLQAVHESYMEAIEDKNKQRQTKLAQFEVDNFIAPSTIQKPLIDREQFIQFLKIGTNEQLENFVAYYCEDMASLAWHSSMYGIYLLNELTLEAFHTAKITFSSTIDSTKLLHELQQVIKSVSTFEQAKLYLMQLIQSLWQWRAAGSNQYNELINKVKLYVTTHYQNNQLSLQDVSKHVGVSPSHLSKIFSQEAKQTLTEYITQTRINKAMELLKTTHYKTFQIAFEVGYQDQHYFSNTFKKVTGVTPIEFRKHGILTSPNYLPKQGEA